MKHNNIRWILLFTLGILILGFIPVVAASGNTTKRPISDWLDPNYSEFSWGENNWAFVDFGAPDNNLAAKMGYPWPKAGFGPFINDMVYENGLVIGETIIKGEIIERALDDGTAMITMLLDVKNAPLTIYDYTEFILYCVGVPGFDTPQAILGAGEDGYIDYKVVFKFINDYPGAPMPTAFTMWDNYISVNIHGIGFGTLTEHAVEMGFAETAGTLGMLKIHQIALFKPDLKDDHPNYDPSYGDLWPVESIQIFELS